MNVFKEISKKNKEYRGFPELDLYAEEQFNDDELMKETILTDNYSLEEVRDFILNKAPFIIIEVYNDGDLVNKCSLAEHLYYNQFTIEITDGLMEIEKTGKYTTYEYMSGDWTYEIVR